MKSNDQLYCHNKYSPFYLDSFLIRASHIKYSSYDFNIETNVFIILINVQ
jgi:hypothetical protein